MNLKKSATESVSERTDKEALNDFLNSIPYGDYKNMRKKLITGCKVPDYIFANWKSGVAKIPPLAKDKMEEIAGRKIFDK